MIPVPSARKPAVTRARRLGIALLVALPVVIGLLAHGFAERQVLAGLRADAGQRLDTLAAAVEGDLTRHAALPAAIQLNPDVLALLRAPAAVGKTGRERANRYLERLNDHLGGALMLVLDGQGRVAATSDWIFSDNHVGVDLSYMPFFKDAAAGAPARHYAIDPVRREPGYYFALPIRDELQDWKIIGVAAVKTELRDIERRWLFHEAPAAIVDGNGIVLFASPPAWRYATLGTQDQAKLERLGRELFAGQPVGETVLDVSLAAAQNGQIVRLPRPAAGDGKVPGGTKAYLATARPLPGTSWQMLVFSDLHGARIDIALRTALAVVAAVCLLLGGLFVAQRRRLARDREASRRLLEAANRELESKVAARTADLSAAVDELQREVAERKRAEQTLRAAQDELVQAAKLAVIGQLAAGITHELNQPLGAIRALSENAAEFMRRGESAMVEKNLGIVGQLAERAAAIVNPLKVFARKSPALSAEVDVAAAVDTALFLFDQRLRKDGVAVEKSLLAGVWIAWCDENRLQQVLVNLIGNALDAMIDSAERRLVFAASRDSGGRIALSVTDTGCGFDDVALARLFEPFFTTKQAGVGLGLGLAISRDILRDFGGDLLAAPALTGGARFTVLLPAAPSVNEEGEG